MSIIHNALKKVQQQQEATRSESTPAQPRSPASGYIYAQDVKPEAHEQPVEVLAPTKNKAKSIFALIGSVAFIIIAFIFLFKQMNTYIPNFAALQDAVKTDVLKLLHKQAPPPPPPPAVPLAKIVVAPKLVATPVPAAKPATTTIAGINIPAAINNELPPIPPEPQTLDVHGVMSNGTSNIALINDQVYQEGDTVDGVKIVKISMDSIVVDNNGKEETIPVKN